MDSKRSISRIVGIAAMLLCVGCATSPTAKSDDAGMTPAKKLWAEDLVRLIAGDDAAKKAAAAHTPIPLNRWVTGARYYVMSSDTTADRAEAETIYWSAEHFTLRTAYVGDGVPPLIHADAPSKAEIVIAVGDSYKKLSEVTGWTEVIGMIDKMGGLVSLEGQPLFGAGSKGDCEKFAFTADDHRILRGLIVVAAGSTKQQVDACVARGFLYVLGLHGETSKASVLNAQHGVTEPEYIDREALRALYGPRTQPGMDLLQRVRDYVATAIVPAT
jgi:hypothetical protein